MTRINIAALPDHTRAIAGRTGRTRQISVGPERNGAFLVVALICLVLSTALIGSVLSLAQRQQRQMLQYQNQLQTEWLAESGLDRAAFRLQADPLYSGEDWTISSSEMGGDEPGEVRIQVRSVPGTGNVRIVHVEANYPAGSLPQRIRRTRESMIILSQEL